MFFNRSKILSSTKISSENITFHKFFPKKCVISTNFLSKTLSFTGVSPKKFTILKNFYKKYYVPQNFRLEKYRFFMTSRWKHLVPQYFLKENWSSKIKKIQSTNIFEKNKTMFHMSWWIELGSKISFINLTFHQDFFDTNFVLQNLIPYPCLM